MAGSAPRTRTPMLAALLCASAQAFTVGPAAGQLRASQSLQSHSSSCCRHDHPRMEDYSTKVKITAETRAPLRQARIFFVYPATIAGASIAAYVSVLRAIGGKGEGLSDFFNLGVNTAIVAGAIFLLTRDLGGRAETLKEVAIELGETDDPNAPLPMDFGEDDGASKPKKKKKKKKSPASGDGFA